MAEGVFDIHKDQRRTRRNRRERLALRVLRFLRLTSLEIIGHRYQSYIAGRDVAAADGRTFTAFNPTTGDQWGTFALAGAEDVDWAVTAASTAFRDGPWR